MDKCDFLHNTVAPWCAACLGIILAKFVAIDVPWVKVAAYLTNIFGT